jgi:hypothetical protein
MLAERGLHHLHWDIDPKEYLGRSAESTAAFVIGRLRRLRGRAVVLMHDTKGASARALPVILGWITEENRRRAERGERRIRILGGSDLVAELGTLPLWSWSRGAAVEAQGRLGHALSRLVPGAPAGAALSLAGPE